MNNWRELYSEYCKQTSIGRFVGKLEHFRQWAVYFEYDLDKMLHSEYKKQHRDFKTRYKEYILWCDSMGYTPFSKSVFFREQDIKKKTHQSIYSILFTWADNTYIENTKYSYEIKKRGIVNQNMCLFYKFYFKRYDTRKNSEEISGTGN